MLTGTASVVSILVDLVAIIGAVGAVGAWLWRNIRRRLVEPVTALAAEVAVIKHEVEFNNGSSVKDAVTRIEAGLPIVNNALDRVERGQVKAVQDIESARLERIQQITDVERRMAGEIQAVERRIDDHIDRHRS